MLVFQNNAGQSKLFLNLCPITTYAHKRTIYMPSCFHQKNVGFATNSNIWNNKASLLL